MLSRIITGKLGQERYNEEVLQYGLMILLGTAFDLLSIAVISLILGTFYETLASTAAFIAIRNFAGGAHLKTYEQCYVISVASFAANGLIARYIYIFPPYLIVAAYVMVALGLVLILKWIPAGTEKKAVKDNAVRLRLKRQTMVVLAVLFILLNLMYYSGYYSVMTAIMLGMADEYLFVTPAGYRVFGSEYH